MSLQEDPPTEPESTRESQRRWRRLKEGLSRTGPKIWEAVQPGPVVIQGMVLGALIMAVLQTVFFFRDIEPGFGLVPDFLLGSFLWLGKVTLAGLIVAVVVGLIRILPRLLSWKGLALVGGTLAAGIVASPYTLFWVLPFSLVAVMLGGSVAAAFGGGMQTAGRAKKVVIVSLLVVSMAALGSMLFFLARRGSGDHLAGGWQDAVDVQPLEAADPSHPGPYGVLTLTYGSGTDKHRPEYGKEADLITDPIDGEAFLKDSTGWKIKLRHWYWGFDFESLPINGRVWYPDGDGPFPLVLIVHGNHRMQEFSDPGYAYLGELLASRGFILVSVDENFLNGGLSNENDCRGWLLLQHLKVWRGWSTEAGNPFQGRVDLDRIALIGHSRGGEAAAIAGAFNRLAQYPDDATVAFDFGFNIRGIIAIAPADGQYEPADQPTPLENVSYLTLQGGHDADVSAFFGSRQLRRVRFSDGGYYFKASLYSYRANHGQFNTVWGDTDFGWPAWLFLNRRALLDGEAQRQLGKVYMTAFLEITLHDDRSYIPLFRDHRTVSRWLPEDIYITYFADSTFRTVCDFEEDVDVTTASLDGAIISGHGLAVWREQHLKFRKQGSKRNGVAYLGWRQAEEDEASAASPASYSVTLPDGLSADWELSNDSLLVLALADADEEPPEPDEGAEEGDEDEAENKPENDAAGREEEEEEEEEEEAERTEPIDFTVELETSEGLLARLALSSFRPIPPVLNSRFTKLPSEGFIYGSTWEPVLQTFELPLARFSAAAPEFDPTALKTIRLVFDRTPEAVIIVDDIGVAQR